MRTTIFWLATPMRTRRSRPLLSRYSVAQRLGQASTSATSPSRTIPGSSGATAACSKRDAAVDRDGGGVDAAGVDVEADEGLVALGHVGSGARRLGWTGCPLSSAGAART